jgi:hypothetical protein
MLRAAEQERLRPAVEQDARLAAVRADRERARAEGHWVAWLRLWFSVHREKREADRQHWLRRDLSPSELRWRAGNEAERRVEDALGRALPGDAWLLFRGYHGRRGEIDCLLLGPSGLFGVEVKYGKDHVVVQGDDWWSQDLDNYGNLVGERKQMRDKGNRSPSQQIAQACAALAEGLRRSRQRVAPVPVVLLEHAKGRLSVKDPTVDIVTSVDSLLGIIRRSKTSLDARQQAEIAALIRRDHNDRPTRPQGRPGRTRPVS